MRLISALIFTVNSNIWRSICSAWRVFMPSSRGYHSIALGLGTILWTINCIYLQLPGGIPPLAELQVSQSEPWRILYTMTSVACAISTARRVGSHVEWWHSWDNLRTTQFVARCTRSERQKWCVMRKHRLVLLTFLRASTKSCLESSQSWGARWFCKMNVGLFCVH